MFSWTSEGNARVVGHRAVGRIIPELNRCSRQWGARGVDWLGLLGHRAGGLNLEEVVWSTKSALTRRTQVFDLAAQVLAEALVGRGDWPVWFDLFFGGFVCFLISWLLLGDTFTTESWDDWVKFRLSLLGDNPTVRFCDTCCPLNPLFFLSRCSDFRLQSPLQMRTGSLALSAQPSSTWQIVLESRQNWETRYYYYFSPPPFYCHGADLLQLFPPALHLPGLGSPDSCRGR